jgi:hypothetical protein
MNRMKKAGVGIGIVAAIWILIPVTSAQSQVVGTGSCAGTDWNNNASSASGKGTLTAYIETQNGVQLLSPDTSAGTAVFGPLIGGQTMYVGVSAEGTQTALNSPTTLYFSTWYTAALNGTPATAAPYSYLHAGNISYLGARLVVPNSPGDYPLEITGLSANALLAGCTVTVPITAVVRVSAPAPAPPTPKVLQIGDAKQRMKWVAANKLGFKQIRLYQCQRDSADMVTCVAVGRRGKQWKQRTISIYYEGDAGPYYSLNELYSSAGFRIGAVCRDGWRSTSTATGTCSHHRGVSYWIYG